ncbi:MAG: hypothetical protein H7Y38_10385 [Armatimonadetes bacterium]|nr:hypothetical protein [Armatimonadota bacterium]
MTTFCPHCARTVAPDMLVCAGCGVAVPPLPHLTPSARKKPSAFMDGVYCLATGIGIFGMMGSVIGIVAPTAPGADRVVAALFFAGFLTLTKFAWRASERHETTSHELTPEEWDRVWASPEVSAALDATELVPRVSNNGNASRYAKRVPKGTP